MSSSDIRIDPDNLKYLLEKVADVGLFSDCKISNNIPPNIVSRLAFNTFTIEYREYPAEFAKTEIYLIFEPEFPKELEFEIRLKYGQ